MKKILVTFFIVLIVVTTTLGVWSPKVSFAQTTSGVIGTGLNIATGGLYGSAAAGASTLQNIAGALDCVKSPVQCFELVFATALQKIGNMILSGVSWLLWLTGTAFNFSIILLVVHMKDVLTNIPALFTVWKVLRDFANMFFIFILLYIAISTILGANGWREMLVKVVLVALFLNFSFFVTGVLIDASNILALQFYNGFAGANCADKATLGVVEKADGCMSYKIVGALKLQSIYDSTNSYDNNLVGTSTTQSQAASLFIASNTNNSDITKFLISIVAGSILMVIVSGIFVASTILIFYRFIELLVLLMISPIAFAFVVIPSTGAYWKEWWNRLLKNLIFAPAYFMFLWICMMVISSGNLQAVLGAKGSFQDAFSAGADASAIFGLMANYVIVIMLLGYSMVLATKLSAAGAKQATAAGKGFQGWVGRNTVGRTASRIANSETMKNFAANSAIGRIAQKPLNSLAGTSFGGRKGGFDKAEKDYVKKQEEFAKTLGPSAITTKRVESKLKQVQAARDQSSRNAAQPFNEREEEIKLVQKQTEQEISSDQEKLDRLNKLSFDPSTESGKKQVEIRNTVEKNLAANKEKLAGVKAAIEKNSKEKRAAIDKEIAGFKTQIDTAQGQVDIFKGVDKDEATKRVTESLRKGEVLTKEEFARRVDEIMKSSTRGIAKERQEKYAKLIDRSWITISPATRAATSAGLMKNVVKGKPEVEKLIDLIKDESKKEKDGGDEDKEKPKEEKEGKEEKK